MSSFIGGGGAATGGGGASSFPSSSSKSIENLSISFNSDGWGPISGSALPGFEDIPYAHFDKKERCGRPADFTQGSQSYQQRPYHQRGFNKYGDSGNTEFAFKHDAEEDKEFKLVDSIKSQGRGGRGTFRKEYCCFLLFPFPFHVHLSFCLFILFKIIIRRKGA